MQNINLIKAKRFWIKIWNHLVSKRNYNNGEKLKRFLNIIFALALIQSRTPLNPYNKSYERRVR